MKTKLMVFLVLAFVNTNAQWQQTNGPYCTIVTRMATNGNNIFAGCFTGGLYRSTNNGASWTNIGFSGDAIFSLAVIGNNVFAGTRQSGVYRSSDNGLNWTAASTGLTDLKIFAIAGNGSTMFAATEVYGLFSSNNNGASWTISLSSQQVRSLAVSGSYVFAGTYGNGMFVSPDNGNSWVAANNGLGTGRTPAIVINGGSVFAATQTGLYVSTNNGASWTLTADTLEIGSATVTELALLATNIFAQTHNGMFFSANNGADWIPVDTSGIGEASIGSFALSGNNIFAGDMNSGTVLKNSLSVALAIDNISSNNSFSIYPNPVVDELNIQNSELKIKNVDIYSFLGEKIFSQISNLTSQISVDVSQLNSGIYFITVTDQAGNKVTRKVIKM